LRKREISSPAGGTAELPLEGRQQPPPARFQKMDGPK
jgi:hypothetical protein